MEKAKIKNYKKKDDNMVSNYKTESAITLIALVITIIVLLILVGVTLSLILRGNLLQKAEDATGWYKDAQTNEISDLENVVDRMDAITGNKGETDNPQVPIDPNKPKAGDVIKTENNIKYTSDGEGNVIPVPEGFTYTGEGNKETGFVIRNDLDLNEFVWIPTDLIEYKTYDWNKGDSAKMFTEFYTFDEEENTRIVEEVTKSVSDHKGYYISRYEAGVLTKREDRTENTQAELPVPTFRLTGSTPVYAYNYLTWGDAVYLGNNLYNKASNNVTSRLINARGWDTAIKFIETIGEDKDATYPTNSSGKGWYTSNLGNDNYETGKSLDLTNTTIPNKLKNIYDMAGNLMEFNAEAYPILREYNCLRGGAFQDSGDSYSAAYRTTGSYGGLGSHVGFRLVLYL